MNVRFEYLYRDIEGHKYWGGVVFANPNNIALGGIIAAAQDALRAGCYFLPSALGLPSQHPPSVTPEHGDGNDCWHEAHSFTGSHELPSDARSRTIEAFIACMQRSSRPAHRA